MIDNFVMVISLPRTGTTSICRMLEMLGYKTYHTPLSKYANLVSHGIGMSDTPCFCPSVINDVLSRDNINTKLIYIERDFESWFESMTKSVNLLRTMDRIRNKPEKDLKPGQAEDRKYYDEVFGDYIFNSPHLKETIKNKFDEHYKIAMTLNPFIYKFENGWGPLCEFLNIEIPENKEIPHLHKKSIGIK